MSNESRERGGQAMIRIGVSGWTYAHWRGGFYPDGLRHADELAYLSERMNSAEINGSFYSLRTPANYASWRDQTPDDFLFAVKGGRFITHMKQLHDVRVPLANFFASGLLGLDAKLGPILWQLPERLTFDAERLGAFLDLLPRTADDAAQLAGDHDPRIVAEPLLHVSHPQPLRHALEVRHDSYREDQCLGLLRAHDVALVLADTAGRFPWFDERTAGFAYVRLHGHERLYAGSYQPDLIGPWADRVRGWAEHGDVFVYFDNDGDGAAPFDAMALAAAVAG